jgi:hypothetical protein
VARAWWGQRPVRLGAMEWMLAAVEWMRHAAFCMHVAFCMHAPTRAAARPAATPWGPRRPASPATAAGPAAALEGRCSKRSARRRAGGATRAQRTRASGQRSGTARGWPSRVRLCPEVLCELRQLPTQALLCSLATQTLASHFQPPPRPPSKRVNFQSHVCSDTHHCTTAPARAPAACLRGQPSPLTLSSQHLIATGQPQRHQVGSHGTQHGTRPHTPTAPLQGCSGLGSAGNKGRCDARGGHYRFETPRMWFAL